MIASLLLVDDNPAELALMTRLAQKTFPGARIDNAMDAAGAEEACSRERYDCVMLDFHMPGADGLDCARRLRAAFAYLPIVMATGHGDEMLAARAISGGVTDYIPKSRLTMPALARVVENAVHVCGQARVIDEQRAELEQFAYALAHDFKQPMRQIKTFSGLLPQAIAAGEAEAVAQYLAFLGTAASRLSDLVDAMTNYALLGQQSDLGNVDLDRLLANLHRMLEPCLADCGGRLILGPMPVVRGNEALLGQVFQNLICNGLKYNRSDAPWVEISCTVQDDRCQLRIRDNGIGIAPQYRDEIFKPLTRLHNAAEYPGTGLGLSLVRKALSMMGGTVTCAASGEDGSEFLVEIGVAERAAKVRPEEKRPRSAPAIMAI